MDSAVPPYPCRLPQTSVGGHSGSYADIESASSVRLLASNNCSASVILQGRKSSWTTAVAVASLVISVVCLVGLGLFGVWFFVWNEGYMASGGLEGGREDTEVCLPCVQISPNPLDTAPSALWEDLHVKYDEDNATEICCASNPAQFAAMFKLILQRQQAVKELADRLENDSRKNESDVMSDDVTGVVTKAGSSAVSAHVVFKPSKEKRSSEAGVGEPREQQWKSPSESPTSHVQEGLRFHDRRVIVQTPGLYYVYCQILYSPSHRALSDVTSSDVVSAYVRRYSILRPSAPSFLLKSRHTRRDVMADRHSSYVGGVFRLHQGDSLYVQVSHPDLISHDDVGSFFGLFRIGD